ncbi:MAG: GntR family transcriptional regulator [Gammaproteobacteria bacterium]|nr:GntR family transcriptional regulator [Gammaproteobacteria bacterium]
MSDLLNSLKAEWTLGQSGALARVPLYHQLYSVLKESIMNGTISYDAQMPTEQQLAATFDVSRITAKRAMDELAAENLIARFRGKGSHVIYQYTPPPVRAPLVGMLENLAEMGKHSIVRVLSVEEVVPPADVRTLLGLGERDTVHKLVRVRSNEEGEPYAYYVSWTLGISKGFTKSNLERTPRLDVIRKNGIKLAKIEQVLSAESASVQIASELDLEPGAALLSIRRLSSNEDGKVVDVLDGLYAPQRYQYTMVLSLD